MSTLFKYTLSEHIQSCVENGVYASRLDNINDPYEARDVRYQEQYRVVCLTSSSQQMLMWAYYGNHKGCCIEYDVTGIDGIQKVNYIRDFISRENMTTDEVIKSLYCKGNEWNHENEHRIVYHAGTTDETLWNHVGDDIFLIAPVKSIIFGIAADLDYKYIEALEYLREYNKLHQPVIQVSKCKLMSDKYQLELDKQFDLDSEIKAVKLDKRKKYKIGNSGVWGGKYRIDGETFVMLNE